MIKTIAIIGQQNFGKCEDKIIDLKKLVKKEIENGANHLILSDNNLFDISAQLACLPLRMIFPDLQITIVINKVKSYLCLDACTKLNHNKLKKVNYVFVPLNSKRKKKIDFDNCKYMVDQADKVYCYLSPSFFNVYRKHLDYAKSTNKPIVNVFLS